MPFAPPFLRDGSLVIAQTANILAYLGPRLGLVPEEEAPRIFANQLQLTIADSVAEAHDAHHPISGGLYYEDQKREAKRRAAAFRDERIPQFLGYFERVLAAGGGKFAIAGAHSYVDLSLFQVVEGLRYAFPNAMKKIAPKVRRLLALDRRVAERPPIAEYLASDRRIPFSEEGFFAIIRSSIHRPSDKREPSPSSNCRANKRFPRLSPERTVVRAWHKRHDRGQPSSR